MASSASNDVIMYPTEISLNDVDMEISNIEKFESAPLNISTYTVIVNLTDIKKNLKHEIDLHLLSRLIPVYDENAVETETMEGCIIGINNYTENPSYTDLPRGKINIKTKYPKSVFNNQLTVLYKYYGFKKINIKIFSNGKLHMTGINDYPWEVKHASNYIINLIKTIQYPIFINKNDFALAPYNYLLYYNPNVTKNYDIDNMDTNINYKIEYYRNNILDYNIQKYIEGDNYDITTLIPEMQLQNDTWLNSDEIARCITVYNTYSEKVISDLADIRNMIVLNSVYSLSLRETIIEKLSKYVKLKSIKKNAIYYMDDNFRSYMEVQVDALNKIMKNYSKRLNDLHDTDTYIISKLYSMYPKLKNKSSITSAINHCIKKYDKTMQNSIEGSNTLLILNKPVIMNSRIFKIGNIDIEFIKSEFNTGYGHILDKMSERLMSSDYNIFNTYDPNEGHAGILVRFYYNELYLNHARPGSCYCEDICRKKKKDDSDTQDNNEKCVCLTIVIFRPGNITITSAKNKAQIEYAYNFINTFIEENKEHVCYNIDKEEVITSKKKKLIKKEPLYIKRDSIVYNN